MKLPILLPLFHLLFLLLLLSAPAATFAATDPGDAAILEAFRKGLDNPELLKWPSSGDPCGPPQWPHVFCSAGRVTQIQVQNLGLQGPLPPNLNQLSKLYNVGLQRNSFRGPLPTFAGLDALQFVYLDFNAFDSIPSDFFDGLTSLQVMALDDNPLNQSTGWALPPAVANAAQLVNFSCSNCNLVGALPDFLGSMPSLSLLHLSYNNLSGLFPDSFRGSNLQSLQLNNQKGDGLSGTIDFLPSMTSLVQVWLHGNSFSGPIPENITQCTSLAELFLNNNKLSGVVPASILDMKSLENVKLDNNRFLGEIPNLKISNFSYGSNPFCLDTPGTPCAPGVDALIDFLGGVNYPSDLAASWSGNDPCSGSWLGVTCRSGAVSVINLPNHNLSGTISPSLGKLQSLEDIRLGGNRLSGTIPANLTELPALKMLNLSGNDLAPPVPTFRTSVTLLTDQNPLINNPNSPATPGTSPGGNPSDAPPSTSPRQSSQPGKATSPNDDNPNSPKGSSTPRIAVIAAVSAVLVAVIVVSLTVCFIQHRKKKKDRFVSSSILVHPRDSSDPKNMLKVTVAQNGSRGGSGSGFQNQNSNAISSTHLIQSGDIMVSVQILRVATNNFSPENELGRGGFGVVYQGSLHDGTQIAVKRMESGVITNKAANEFTSEIEVLSKVRHRNLVSLLGHSMEGPERLLVYEFMPQGALSKHLFKWKSLNLEPLSWKRRLNIALDVARGLEYLHTLAQQSFIHRDLKSANILLDDDYRAKISDFGLVKHASDGNNSVCTRLAGTFGYLAPEYAVTGKVTTKADVYSFGVVLMELITGLAALDDSRSEETRYLAYWFFEVKSSKEKLRKAIDPSLDVSDETFESILTVSELAGHCAARDPILRPDMGHAVNVLAPLVEKWKPVDDDQDEYLGIDFHQPLLHMVECWQAADGSTMSSMSLDDSKGSIPARPAGFAESFTSADGR